MIIDQCVGFPAEGYSNIQNSVVFDGNPEPDFSFTDVEFHRVSSAPSLY
jgi:hypothetical protein